MKMQSELSDSTKKTTHGLRRPPAWFWIAGAAFVGLLLPRFFTGSYSIHLMVLSCIYLILTISYNMIVGYTGYLTLAHNTFFGIGAYVSAILTAIYGMHFGIGILAGILLSGVISLAFGWLLFTRLRGFTFSIVTLGLAITAYIIVLNWIDVTRGPMGIPAIPRPSLTVFGETFRLILPLHFYFAGLVLVLITFGISHWIANSRVGLALFSIRENEKLAEAVGVNALKYKLFVFVLASVIASLAGSFYAHYFSLTSPEIFWTFWITGLLAMLIVGGPGSRVYGVIIGTILLVILPEVLRIAQGMRELIYGIGLVFMIIFIPQGIGGWIERTLYHRRLQQWQSSRSKE